MNGEKNSVIAVLEAIAEHSEISRAALSELTGFSLMTVGKAVDELEKGGIIVQRKQSSGAVGRKMSVCNVKPDCGMLIYDFTDENCRVRICDLVLDVRGEYQSSAKALSDLMVEGFGYFFETFGGELIGIGAVVPDGQKNEMLPLITSALGNPSDLVIEAKNAYVAANLRRFDAVGMSAFIRLFANNTADCSIVRDGFIYNGAHERAGSVFNKIRARDEIPARICDLCAVLDPVLIHIACETDSDAGRIVGEVSTALHDYGIEPECQPEIIAQPIDKCLTAADGAAILLRERLIMQKMAKK